MQTVLELCRSKIIIKIIADLTISHIDLVWQSSMMIFMYFWLVRFAHNL